MLFLQYATEQPTVSPLHAEDGKSWVVDVDELRQAVLDHEDFGPRLAWSMKPAPDGKTYLLELWSEVIFFVLNPH